MTDVTEANPKAVQLLEKGIKALQKKNWKTAVNNFNSLIEKFPAERGLRDRALAYLSTVERLTAAKPKAPTDGDEILRQANYHLNNRELEEARKLLDAARKKPSIKPQTTYFFALYHALAGEEETALDCLAEAIELDETANELPRFQELVD
jgi:outer membrane protein assembly factor BamD (BamD/ComL family)